MRTIINEASCQHLSLHHRTLRAKLSPVCPDMAHTLLVAVFDAMLGIPEVHNAKLIVTTIHIQQLQAPCLEGPGHDPSKHAGIVLTTNWHFDVHVTEGA